MRPSPHLILVVLLLAAATVLLTLALTEPGLAVAVLWLGLMLALLVDAVGSVQPRQVTAAIALPLSGQVGVALGYRIVLRHQSKVLPAVMAVKLDLDAALGDGILPDVQGGGPEAVAVGQLPLLRRGVFQLRALHLKWPSRFGLMEIMTRVAVGQTVTVVPDTGPVTSGQIQAQMLPLLSGQKDMRIKGSGSEFHQLREFSAGMDSRQIDWKRSARLRTLVARETRAERNHQIILTLDCGYLMSERIAGLPKLDAAITAALSLGWAAGLGGDLIGFYAFDSQPRQYLPPMPGRSSFPRLQAAAAALNYADQETNHTLGLSQLLTKVKRRSLIVVFSDFVDSITAELLVENVTLLSRHHLMIFVTLRDPALTQLAQPKEFSLNDIAASVAAGQMLQERQAVMEKLSRLGVLCLDVAPAELTSALVSKYIDIKARELI